ncbi:MAG: ABC transporter permease [Candidatus Velthaea sp.]
MNDIPVIFQAELLRKIRSRPFILATLIGAAAIVGLSYLPSLLENTFATSSKRIVLAGDPGLVARAKVLLAKDFRIVATQPAPARPPTNADIDRYKASALAVLEQTPTGLRVTAYARDASTFRHAFGDDLVPLNVALATHLDAQRIDPLLTVPVDVKSLDTKFVDQQSADEARGVAYLLVLLLYMSILINSQTVMSSVAEEKTSRIAELLVATTSPAQLLAGKILAAGLAGLIQLAVWTGAGLLAGQRLTESMFSRSGSAGTSAAAHASSSFGILNISTGVALAFVAFFLIGFLQYASLYAAAASLINRTEDLGSVAVPLVIPVVGGFVLAQYALAAPNSTNVQIISQIPLLAPFVMFTRLAVATIPAWQIGLSIAINALATVVILWGAGKVYRVGLLLYGRLPSPRQVLAALRA